MTGPAAGPSIRYAARPRSIVVEARENRFLARVRGVDGGPAFGAHVPNPGRMEELLVPGLTRGYVVPAAAPHRRTAWDLIAVRHGRTLVSTDARVGNRLVAAALVAGILPGLPASPWRPEPRWGEGRFDFAWPATDHVPPRRLIEVKCSNLRVGRTALFPDAPTERGARHARVLAAAQRAGVTCTIIFVVQRNDVDEFRPNGALDPSFADALAEAGAAGVRVWAFTSRVAPGRLSWGRRIPVRLPSSTKRL